jgi:protein-S-isoprenylcysteine O-methyltransferase Ste14
MSLVTRDLLPREESKLEAEFGEEYDEYRAEVNALVPTTGRWLPFRRR